MNMFFVKYAEVDKVFGVDGKEDYYFPIAPSLLTHRKNRTIKIQKRELNGLNMEEKGRK